MDNPILLQFGVPVALIIGLLASVEIGFRVGQSRSRGSDSGKAMETGAIQGAMLGLLGLLLGFSFAGASGRFMERQDLISREANSINAAWLRADLLDEPYASSLREELQTYVDARVEASESLHQGLGADVVSNMMAIHERIWATTVDGVEAKPRVMVAVTNPVNDVFDLHGMRVAAAHKHLPGLVVALLVCCSALTLGVIGYACALAKRRNTLLTSVIAVLIAAALWTTIDLDRSRIGLIQVSDAALVDLQTRMRSAP